MTQPPVLAARGKFYYSICRCGADSETGQGIKHDSALLTERAGTVQRGTCPSRGNSSCCRLREGCGDLRESERQSGH